MKTSIIAVLTLIMSLATANAYADHCNCRHHKMHHRTSYSYRHERSYQGYYNRGSSGSRSNLNRSGNTDFNQRNGMNRDINGRDNNRGEINNRSNMNNRDSAFNYDRDNRTPDNYKK